MNLLLHACFHNENSQLMNAVQNSTKTHWQAQKIVFSYKCFGQQYKDFVVLYIAFVFRPQLGFQLRFSRLYSKLNVVKYNVTVKFGTNCLELTPWKFTPFGFSPGSVVNYKLLRASYKSMESMEIIFHSEEQWVQNDWARGSLTLSSTPET